MRKALRYSTLAVTLPTWSAFAGFYAGSFAIGVRLAMCMGNIGTDSCFSPDHIDDQLRASGLFVAMTALGALGGLYPAYRLANAYFPGEPPQQASRLQKGLNKINENHISRPMFKVFVALTSALAGIGMGWGLGVTSETSWCQTFVKFCYETDSQYKPYLMKSEIFMIPQIFFGLNGLLAGYKIGEHALNSATKSVNFFNPDPASAELLDDRGQAARDPQSPSSAARMT
ncbi:MAG: hypothetical protein P1U40_04425 [Coxiellaceae bacterium]|nr:hypothetical protein [Coxiellaceae bacterium]